MKIAIVAGKTIRRRNITWSAFQIKPTDTTECCILLVVKNGRVKNKGPRWNPTAKDLMADDWEVVGK